MQKEFALLTPFNYRRISESKFEFTTLAGVVYLVTFFDASSYFWQYPEFSYKVKTFQFEVMHNPHPILPLDSRVGETISYFILQFFKQETEGVLFFVHEKSDGKDKGRFRKFESWFKRNDDERLTKRDAEINLGKSSILISILLRKDHPQFEEIISGFDELVLENSEKPDE